MSRARLLRWAIVALVVLGLGPDTQALEWMLEPPCANQALEFLVAPEAEEAVTLDHSGSRTWNLGRWVRASARSGISPECVQPIWDQAYGDAHEYWTDQGRYHSCLNSDLSLPAARPTACRAARWERVSDNLRYLNYIRSTFERSEGGSEPSETRVRVAAAGSDCPPTEVSEEVTRLGAELAEIVGPEPTSPARPAEARVELEASTVFAEAPPAPAEIRSGIPLSELTAPHACANIPISDRVEDPRESVLASLGSGTAACVWGALEGIYNTITSTLEGLWGLVCFGGNVVLETGSALWDLAHALYGGSATSLVSEWMLNADRARERLVNAFMMIPQAIQRWLANESDHFMCLNATAQREYICRATTRVIGEIGLAAIGVAELRAVARLPAVARAGAWADEAIRASRVVRAAGEAATWYRNLRVLERMPTGLTWFVDASSGSRIATDGERVFVRLTDAVAEVTDPRMAQLMTRGLETLSSATTTAYRSVRALASATDSTAARGMNWVRDTASGLSVAYHEGRAYIRRAGQVFEVTQAELSTRIRSAVRSVEETYERNVTRYRDELAEWRVRAAAARSEAAARTRTPSAASATGARVTAEVATDAARATDAVADTSRVTRAADDATRAVTPESVPATASRARPPFAREVTTPSGRRVVFEGEDAAGFYRLAENSGVLPTTELTVRGERVRVGPLFEIGEGRVAALMEVEVDGVWYARTVYRSNSQAGFRLLPARNLDLPFVPGFDKGIGEFALDLPTELQAHFSTAVRSGSVRRIPPRDADALLDGSVRTNRSMMNYVEYHEASGGLATEVRESGLLADDIERPLRTSRGVDRARPESVRVVGASAPDFSSPITRYRTSSALAGNIEAVVYRSRDGTLDYTVFRGDDGRIWIGSVQDVTSSLSSYGVSTRAVQPAELTMPRWEYAEQIPGRYIGPSSRVNRHYADAWSYLREMPIIGDWYRAQGIPIPP